MNEIEVTRKADLGPLHRLMLKACPPDAQGKVSITVLADAMKMSRATLHKWAARNQLEPWLAQQLVDVSEGRITLDECDVFVYVMPVD